MDKIVTLSHPCYSMEQQFNCKKTNYDRITLTDHTSDKNSERNRNEFSKCIRRKNKISVSLASWAIEREMFLLTDLNPRPFMITSLKVNTHEKGLNTVPVKECCGVLSE